MIYKPHPDVVAGLRRLGEHDTDAASLCNEVLPHAEMAHLLDQVDEGHVMTSLTELLHWRAQSGGRLSWWRLWLRPLLARP